MSVKMQGWWGTESGHVDLHHAVIAALKGLKQEDYCEFEASQRYAVTLRAL